MAHLKDDPANDARIKEFKASVRNIPLADVTTAPASASSPESRSTAGW